MIQLPEQDVRALRAALDHEYCSLAEHDRLIRDLGAAPVLERIRDIEADHIRVLECLHARYGVQLARKRRRGRIVRFKDPVEACAAAIEAEAERGRIYRQLIQDASEADVRAELRNLERASRNGHLPALQAWAKQLAQVQALDRSRGCHSFAVRTPG